ncbi:bifunctional phosphopantothenoylcysteine decarboxylase/phosphopantothenate--cysteine ligase CoaBC [Polymorphobacter fuscus]|uniref:Coenzyme A biosynthesis bifunctional protein CoaBC n=1 Tax=Sandarakinorhabdus fusca TaxID=1439888 RepID=A0A7C9KK04_9SPHN|nr:bifunctional phosphopantothenoylcysteine decarboxylase/phosphopantothenate--cysteine ligase CoaBC [Polymorphobacter fuscus]KAB7644064.1 bifunctional phosphopantothenoylcysteine decarboxylase/phosphopantothenate--cysteine ligase CoaBC [Polymorphobacter fuscus]MQT18439.1 bifunctional phosphopantothenoylcysteine decarboxylase/phosphopantothenate--cysteine ligase CoaBC [Polymorphobacter fuscus]NJC08441.1 phosphopantothenoylcysteine decarboxylase/phosphopantothenate--cysteine ligase [Polymorphobac
MHGKTILLIVGGGIAAFKALELVRELRRAGARVIPVLTENGARFVTPLSLGALAEAHVRTSLWDLEAESTMGHIQLSRAADLVVVCPATADLMARAATGQADDLASTLLLATDTPVLMVPAMNVRMWLHHATRRNMGTLRADGVRVMDPDDGEMACGEFGPGRLPTIAAVMAEIAAQFGTRPLAGRHALVTAGPTHEAIDPVRFIGNNSSGKQGFAIADALAAAGARVTLVAGPVGLPTPAGVTRIDVTSARDMLAATEAALPADIAVMVAAVADWRVDAAAAKLKKSGDAPPVLALVENPDILATIGHAANRPRLVIGFAAETDDLLAHAAAKLARKGADWILANDVRTGVFGTDANHVHLVTAAGTEDWGAASKTAIAEQLVQRIAAAF